MNTRGKFVCLFASIGGYVFMQHLGDCIIMYRTLRNKEMSRADAIKNVLIAEFSIEPTKELNGMSFGEGDGNNRRK